MRNSRRKENYLEHLDVRYAQVQISGVTEDETAAEEGSNGEDRFQEHVLRHIHVLSTVEQRGCSLKYPCAYRLERIGISVVKRLG